MIDLKNKDELNLILWKTIYKEELTSEEQRALVRYARIYIYDKDRYRNLPYKSEEEKYYSCRTLTHSMLENYIDVHLNVTILPEAWV